MRIFRRKMIVEDRNLCGVVMIMTIGIFSVVKFLGAVAKSFARSLFPRKVLN